jgi:aminoglycoside phosphotransferase (APT) family kinase protein
MAESRGDASSRLMRAIAEELRARILPDLKSPDAIERASLARQVLLELAADLDTLPSLAAELVPQIRATICTTLSDLRSHIDAGTIADWSAALDRIASEQGIAAQREVAALRQLGADITREIADSARQRGAPSAALESAVKRLGAIDHLWLTRFDSARAQVLTAVAPAAIQETTTNKAAPETAAVTTANVTAYLRRAFSGAQHANATEVIQIPGGRSKKTFFVSVANCSTLPSQFVVRQDYALKYEGTKVRDEFRPLSKLAALGMPVPKPLHLEPEESELGPPFIIVERLRGSAPGSYFGLRDPCPGAFRELARMLAQLHRVAPAELGFEIGADPEKSLEHIVDRYEKKWRANATKPSALVDYAYAWARREARREPGSFAVVHGDAGPYNFLVDGTALSAVLDWEFAHVGDPAEDLGIARIYAEGVMDWREFLDIYMAAGGAPIAEHRVHLGMLVQYLKGTTLVAASGRNFEEGATSEFIKGASSFTGLRLIESRIAALLQRFAAV